MWFQHFLCERKTWIASRLRRVFGGTQNLPKFCWGGDLSVMYFFVYCGANFERRIFAKSADFSAEEVTMEMLLWTGVKTPFLQEHFLRPWHSAVWSTRKQWRQEGTKEFFSGQKVPKRAVPQQKMFINLFTATQKLNCRENLFAIFHCIQTHTVIILPFKNLSIKTLSLIQTEKSFSAHKCWKKAWNKGLSRLRCVLQQSFGSPFLLIRLLPTGFEDFETYPSKTAVEEIIKKCRIIKRFSSKNDQLLSHSVGQQSPRNSDSN